MPATLQQSSTFDRKARIEAAVQQVFGSNPISTTIASEIAMMYYLLRWPTTSQDANFRLEAPVEAKHFSYHRESGMIAILFAFLLAVFVELTAVHIFLAMWSKLAAWIATLSSVYVAMLIVAHVRAIPSRPIYVHEGTLQIFNGLYRLASIPLDLIERVDVTSREPDLQRQQDGSNTPLPLNCSTPVAHNVILYLSQDCEAELLMGRTKKFDVALLHIDDRHDFAETIKPTP